MKKLAALFLTFLMTGLAFGTDYYISSQADFNTYRDATFSPGDRILLERGGVFTGMLEPRGSGTPGNVITISAYGTGNLPVIHNNGVFHPHPLRPGVPADDISASILLFNVEYWEVNNIECTNYSSASGSDNSLYMYGIFIRAEDTTDPYDHIYIEDCYVHHINVELDNDIRNAKKNRGAIHARGYYTGPAYHAGWFNDLRIVNNRMEYIGGTGITLDAGGRIVDAHTFLGDSREGAWTNVYIADNYIGYTGRNSMIIRDCDYAMVEYNTLAYSSRDSTGHSSYCHTTLGITFQYNEAYGNTGDASDKDRGGFDADNNCKDTFIQYNYSHNNEWFCGIMKDANMNVTIRYNLSVNERHGAYYYGFESQDDAYNTKIYNNTHYFKSSITPDILCNNRTPVHTTFNNNIFYCEGSGNMGLNAENGTDNVYDNNVYYNVTPPSVELNPITTDSLFVSPGTEPYDVDMRNGRDVLDGYRLSLASPHIDAGLTIYSNGGHDFWGEPVPEGDTDIGASENLTTILPDPATIVSPANGATGVSRTADINWNAGAGTASHDVYFGTDSTPDSGEFIGNQAPTTYDPGVLSSNTTYYWSIDEVNAAGTTTGSVWSFTTGTQITPVVTVSPATDIDITSATLHGEVTDTAGEIPSVTLYYGDDDAGEVAGSWDNSVSMGTQSSTFSTPIGGLTIGTTYYYRAFASNSTGSDWSDVTSFETASSKEIIFDAVSGGKNNATTFTWAHDLGGGDDRVVVVGIGIEQSNVVISSVTFNSVAMTLADGSLQDSTTNLTAIYYMLEADLPPAGTYDIVVTSDIGDSIGAGAISLKNVKQEPPEAVENDEFGRTTYGEKSITTLTDGAWIIDVVGSGDGSMLTPGTVPAPPPPLQELRYWYQPSSSAVAGSTRVVPTAGTVTNGWTADKNHRISLSMAAFAPVEVAIGPIPPTVDNAAATNITSNSARLNGEVTDNGDEDPTVMIYWGDNDGVTDPNSGVWDHIELLGTQNSTFFEDIISLSAETTYYFRAYAYNSAGGDWADSTESFATIPNNPPVWTVDPTDKADAIEDKPYVGSLSGDATDPDVGDVLEYSYVSGPAWLSIAANGDLSGTPAQTDVGGNSWIVSVTDGLSTPVEATVNITVLEIYDGENGLEDFARLSSLWLQTACGYCLGSDLNYDGDVGIDDLRIMAERWLSVP